MKSGVKPWLGAVCAWFTVLTLSAGAFPVPSQDGRVDGITLSDSEMQRILSLSPLPELPADLSNAVADNPRAVAFGRQLFFDKRLSSDGERSCATCHDPEQHWTDGEVVSNPNARFPKNVPTLWNTAYNRWFFWDGRADSAWAQALGPLEHPDEMGSSRLRIAHVVRSHPDVRREYAAVFGALPLGLDDSARFPLDGKPAPKTPENALHRAWASMTEQDKIAINRLFSNVGKAIAAFERTIVSSDMPLDSFVSQLRAAGTTGNADRAREDIVTAAELRGLKLFVGRANCTLCHSGPLLSDGEFHDVGIALGAHMRVDPGRHRGVFTLQRSPFTQTGAYADRISPTAPIEYLDQQSQQLGQFKTPSLRGIAQTAPYMHDGRFATLKDVVTFYSTREGAHPLGHSTLTLLQPLDLNDGEISDLVSFLETLSFDKTLQPTVVGR